MEPVEPVTPAAAAPVTPEPVPAPAAPAPYVAPPPPPPIGDGTPAGGKGNVVSRFFEDVSFTDVGMLVITSCAIFFVVDYYRKKIKYLRDEEVRLSNKVDELTANVQNFIGSQQYNKFSEQ